MAHVADEALWTDLVNGPVVVHLRGTSPKEIATWLKKEYWEGKCTMPDSVLVQKIEAATNKGFLRRRRFHGGVKNELRTLQPHERVRLERKACRKAQHADRTARRILAYQAQHTAPRQEDVTPVVVTTPAPPSLVEQIEQCWHELNPDQDMRYPAAA